MERERRQGRKSRARINLNFSSVILKWVEFNSRFHPTCFSARQRIKKWKCFKLWFSRYFPLFMCRHNFAPSAVWMGRRNDNIKDIFPPLLHPKAPDFPSFFRAALCVLSPKKNRKRLMMFLFYDSFECKFMFTRNVLHIRKIYEFVLWYYLILFLVADSVVHQRGKIMDQQCPPLLFRHHFLSLDVLRVRPLIVGCAMLPSLRSITTTSRLNFFYYQFLSFITHSTRRRRRKILIFWFNI